VKYSKILSILGISCVVTLLLIFGVRLQAQNESKDKITTAKVNEMRAQAMQRGSQFRNRQQGSNLGTQGRQQGSQSGEQGRSESSESKDKPDFYRVIVDNNIFRPLGWRPPNKEPEYTFVGTRVDSNGAASEAYVLETRSNQFFMANIGDKIGDAIVKEIKQKEIILDKNGEVITLRGGKMAFLQTGGSRGGPSRGSSNARNEDSSNGNRSTSKSSDKENASAKKAQANAQKMRQQMMERAQEMRRRYEGASREQREQMMREFRGRGRGRRDR
jgi:hypothetical protein